MRNGLKLLGAGVLGTVVAVVIVGLMLAAFANSESTTCYGIFGSGDAAGRAAQAGREAGFDTEHDYRGTRSLVTFTTGESGDDADESRRAFGAIVARERGRLGHPGDGCLERGRLGE